MALEGLAVALLGQGAGAEGRQQGGAHAGERTPLLTPGFMLYHIRRVSDRLHLSACMHQT